VEILTPPLPQCPVPSLGERRRVLQGSPPAGKIQVLGSSSTGAGPG